ncbi:MAG: urease accessory protein UreE [Armatimonadota bacterium]|nr:urease accessory protein UreE [Armatimonadota bacterium]MDR7444252.1 urease accessory protein UreE [Armatimonadota bacterium]MDR7570500.1 urease accessory protein UreE [Armatimonadota bacterium]MDR7614214.1 urease accessory protein UreE [Armatimonadota bacterium]
MSEVHGLRVVDIPMTAEERSRVRRRVVAPDGRVLLLALPTGTVLRPGQVLAVQEGVAYRVRAAEEDVLVVYPGDLEEAVRIGHFFGNLHREIEVQGGAVVVPWDDVLFHRARQMGWQAQRDRRPFHGKPGEGHRHP